MESQSVLLQTARGEAIVERRPIPVPARAEVLVKVKAVALNPYDWKMLFGRDPPIATVLGCDFAGIVAAVGDDVTRTKPGDRVAAMIQGGNVLRPTDGAFAEYAVAPAHILLRLPEHMTFEDGCTVPTPIFTAGFCLYKQLCLLYPDTASRAEESTPIFVYGGATAIGSMQLQLAKQSGIKSFTVCSRESFDYVQRSGADEVFDYNDPSCSDSLRNITQGKIRFAVDCICTAKSAALCSVVMDNVDGGTYISTTAKGPVVDNPQVDVVKIVAFTILNREFAVGLGAALASPVVDEDVQFGAEFSPVAEELLKQKRIHPIPKEVREDGLSGIVSGLENLRAGKVHRRRLVYSIP